MPVRVPSSEGLGVIALLCFNGDDSAFGDGERSLRVDEPPSQLPLERDDEEGWPRLFVGVIGAAEAV